MKFDNIIEKRKVNNGKHSLVLEMSREEYDRSYNQYNNEIASEIVESHLLNRGDDGRPSNVKIKNEENNDIIKIHANLSYLGNDHTDYRMKWYKNKGSSLIYNGEAFIFIWQIL